MQLAEDEYYRAALVAKEKLGWNTVVIIKALSKGILEFGHDETDVDIPMICTANASAVYIPLYEKTLDDLQKIETNVWAETSLIGSDFILISPSISLSVAFGGSEVLPCYSVEVPVRIWTGWLLFIRRPKLMVKWFIEQVKYFVQNEALLHYVPTLGCWSFFDKKNPRDKHNGLFVSRRHSKWQHDQLSKYHSLFTICSRIAMPATP